MNDRHVLLHLIVAGVVTLLAATRAESAVVLQYHHISDTTPKATSITPKLFKQHMAFLAENDYRIVPLPDLVKAMRENRPLPDRTIAITFDDGYESVYYQAFPVLKQYDWPFTVFVNTKPIEQGLDSFVTWDNLREMAQAKATIANHSFSHPHFLRRLEEESTREWRARITREIETAEQQIRQNTQQDHRFIAYPYGEYDEATQELLREMNYVGFGQQSGPLNPRDNLQALPRFPFGGNYGSMDDFTTKVASLPLPFTEATVRDNRGRVLPDAILPEGETQPSLELKLESTDLAQRLQCFASRQGSIPLERQNQVVRAQAPGPLPVGRSRYNCTAASGQSGRFYWYSQFFIRKQDDGGWYPEP